MRRRTLKVESFNTVLSRALSSVLALTFWGCSSPPSPLIVKRGKPVASKGTGSTEVSADPELQKKALELFDRSCKSCHGSTSAGAGGFSKVMDLGGMISGGYLTIGEPAKSKVHERLSGRGGQVMPPPPAAPFNDAEKSLVSSWIMSMKQSDVATKKAVNYAQALSTVQAVFESLPGADKPFVRIIDVRPAAADAEIGLTKSVRAAHLFFNFISLNAGQSKKLEVVKNSNGQEVPGLLKLDLRAFDIQTEGSGWSKLIEGGDDYSLCKIFSGFEKASRDANLPRGECAIVRLEPLIHKMRNDGNAYYSVLGLPGTRAQLETQLGLNIGSNYTKIITNPGTVRRTAYLNSGVSQFARSVERHSLGNERPFWMSFEFTDPNAESNQDPTLKPLGPPNAFRSLSNNVNAIGPLEFNNKGNEIIFMMPNGFPAFFANEGNLNRLASAPTKDPNVRIPVGFRCLSCHTAGLNPISNSVTASEVTTDGGMQNIINSLFSTSEQLKTIIQNDNQKMGDFVKGDSTNGIGAPPAGEALFSAMVDLEAVFAQSLDVTAAAAELGVTKEALETKLKDSQLPASLRAIREGFSSAANPKVTRAVFSDSFENLMTWIYK